jgi:hypothetical protein
MSDCVYSGHSAIYSITSSAIARTPGYIAG